MELKVMKPSCTVGTLAMGTASKGPRAIPAALQVTKAAGTTHQMSMQSVVAEILNQPNLLFCFWES